jgi:hypothetical protein
LYQTGRPESGVTLTWIGLLVVAGVIAIAVVMVRSSSDHRRSMLQDPSLKPISPFSVIPAARTVRKQVSCPPVCQSRHRKRLGVCGIKPQTL